MSSQSGTHCHTIYGRHDMAARQASYIPRYDMLKATRDRGTHIYTVNDSSIDTYGGGYHTSYLPPGNKTLVPHV